MTIKIFLILRSCRILQVMMGNKVSLTPCKGFKKSVKSYSVRAKKQAGFTLIEILVVLAIIAILMSFIFPAVSRAKEQANVTKCISNVKQVALALTMYAGDHDDELPAVNQTLKDSWVAEMIKGSYLKPKSPILHCPSDHAWNGTTRITSYGLNSLLTKGLSDHNGVLLSAIDNPSEMIMTVELNDYAWGGDRKTIITQDYVDPAGWPGDWTENDKASVDKKRPVHLDETRHGDKSVYSYVDGHAKLESFGSTYKEGTINKYDPEFQPKVPELIK